MLATKKQFASSQRDSEQEAHHRRGMCRAFRGSRAGSADPSQAEDRLYAEISNFVAGGKIVVY
jgi:hypothetical protein